VNVEEGFVFNDRICCGCASICRGRSYVSLLSGRVLSITIYTFAILDRRKDLTRNLHLSSSVCIITRANDVPASMREVLSSIVSIYAVPHAYGVPSADMLSM